MPAHYFYRLNYDSDHLINEFCVLGHSDPDQFVETLADDGRPQRWDRREVGPLLIFAPPVGYDGGQGLLWAYDRRLQTAAPLPMDEMESRALRGRISVTMPQFLLS